MKITHLWLGLSLVGSWTVSLADTADSAVSVVAKTLAPEVDRFLSDQPSDPAPAIAPQAAPIVVETQTPPVAPAIPPAPQPPVAQPAAAAAAPSGACAYLAGSWVGRFDDKQGLYPPRLGILAKFSVKGNRFAGTISNNMGSVYTVRGTCSNDHATFYIFSYVSELCGCASQVTFTHPRRVAGSACFENAMISTNGLLSLQHVNASTDTQPPKSLPDSAFALPDKVPHCM